MPAELLPHIDAPAAQVTLPVDGMTCAACQSHVQRALRTTPGVNEATVNLMMHSATISYDPRVLTPQALVEAINETGYESRLPEPDVDALAEDDARERSQRAEYHTLLRKSLVSMGAGIAAMVLSMPLMTSGAHGAHGSSDPLQRWVMDSLDPALRAAWPALYRIDPRLLGWVLLAVTVAVMSWAGRHFYVRAWKALAHRTADMNVLVAVGTGSRLPLLRHRHRGPARLHRQRRLCRRLLRSHHLHPVAAAARQRARSARQDPHDVGSTAAGAIAAVHRQGQAG